MPRLTSASEREAEANLTAICPLILYNHGYSKPLLRNPRKYIDREIIRMMTGC